MSIAVPVQDLAPALPSRVVTLKFADMLEGLPEGDKGTVTFKLPGDLRVPANGVIVQAGEKTVVLDGNAEGRIRLPVYSSAAIADSIDGEWFLLVGKSWSEQVDMIRVPTGTAPISLAEITPIREVTPAMSQWLLTGAGVEMVEGAQWGATVSVAGGIARFKFTVPPGGAAYWRGTTPLSATADLDSLESGKYAVYYQVDANALGLPGSSSGILTVSRFGTDRGIMSFETNTAPSVSFTRTRTSAGWSTWEPTSRNSFADTGALGSVDLDTVTTAGVYLQASDTAGTAARNYPISYGTNAGRGTLTVAGDADSPQQTYYDALVGQISNRYLAGGAWSPWRPVNPQRRKNLTTEHLDTVTGEGTYIQKSAGSATAANGYPAGAVHGILTVQSMGGGPADAYWVQTWLDTWNGWLSIRRFYAGVWTSWEKIGDDFDAAINRIEALEGAAASPLVGVRVGEHEARVEGLRQRIGHVQHAKKAVVALVLDHGSKNFQDIVLPKLRQHAMKSTLAMTSTQLTLEPANEVTAWSTVAGWAAADRVEVASHSRTHQDVTGLGALRQEIVTSRDELSTNLGGLPVDSWVQPGARNILNAAVGAYDGFKDGLGADRYWSTPAGEMIRNAYAMSTGQVTQQTTRVYPCTGEPPLGAARRFIDDGQVGIDAAKADIAAAIASGGRCIVSLHPAYIRTDGRTDMITRAQVEAFIDYLAGLVTAGTIAMVQLREWALAEASAAAHAHTQADITGLATALSAATWKKSALPASADIAALADGTIPVASGSAISTLVGPPQIQAAGRYPGVLELVTSAGGQRIARFTPTSGPAADGLTAWLTAYNGTAWSEWRLTTSTIHPRETVYATLDAMPEGEHKVSATTTVTRLGLPVSRPGAVKIVDLGGTPNYRKATFEDIDGNVWFAIRATGIWSAWLQIVRAAGVGLAATTPSGWKTTALAVTASQSPVNAPLSGTWRVPVHWNVPVRRFRVRVTLRNARHDGFIQGAGVQLDGIWLGDHAGGGAFTGTPQQIVGAVTIPDNGADYVSAWIDVPIGDAVERLLSYSYTATTAPTYQVAQGWEHAGKVGAQIAPTGGVSKTAMPLNIHIEAEIPSLVPIVAVFGDSKAVGVGAARSILDSSLSQWCRANGAAPMHMASSGDSLQGYAAGTWKISRWDGVVSRPDYILIELGINDLLTRTAVQMAADRATLIGKIRQSVGSEIGVVTIAPNEAHTSGQLAERQAYNAPLRAALPADVNRLFDFDRVIALDPSTIRPEWDTDGLHLNAAGYAAEAAVLRHVVAPARAV